MNTASSTSQGKYMGPSSLQVPTQWLGFTFHIFDHNFSELFLQEMRHREEIDMPLQVRIPSIPSDHDWMGYLNTYFDQFAPLFHVVQRMDIIQAASQLFMEGEPEKRPAADRLMIAHIHACIAIGAGAKGHAHVARTYIEYACSLYGHLVASLYLRSAQALLLIAIEHRDRNKDGAACQVLGQAIRILNSMGLHKEQPHTSEQSDRRIWWTACALEIFIVLESGRPSSIHENDIDHDFPSLAITSNQPDIVKVFADLAKIQGQITDRDRLFIKNIWTLHPDLCDVLNIQSELDQSLLRLSDHLPDVLKPSRDLLSCPPDILPFRSFLTFQHHQTLITLHRAALLRDPTIHNASMEASGVDPSYTRLLRWSETIYANSGRDIITMFMKLSSDGYQVTAHSPFD